MENNCKNNILRQIVPSIGGEYMKQTKSNFRLNRARESSKRSIYWRCQKMNKMIQLMKDQKKKQENILVKILKGGDRK